MDEDRFLRLPDVVSMVGMCRCSIYKYIKKGMFPAPMKFGDTMSFWSCKDIQRWMAERRASGRRDLVSGPEA